MDRWENYQQYDSFMTSHIVKLEEIEKIKRRAEWERQEKIRLADEKRQKELEEQAAIAAEQRQREWEQQQRAARIRSRGNTVGLFICGLILFVTFTIYASESFFSYKSLIPLLMSLLLMNWAWNEDEDTFYKLIGCVFFYGFIFYGLYLFFENVRSFYAKLGIITVMMFFFLLFIGCFVQVIFEED